MRKFFRVAAIILLILIGFGTGICGLFGVGVTLFDGSGWQHSDRGLVAVLSAVFLSIAAGCFFAVRGLIRRLRAAREQGPG